MKSRQFLHGTVDFFAGCGKVNLDNLTAFIFSCILNSHGQADPASFFSRLSGCQSKIRVSQPEPERKQGVFPDGIKVTISDINAFFVAGVVLLALLADMAVVLPCGPRRSQLSGRRTSAKQNIRQHRTCLRAELPQQQNIGYLFDRRKINRTADVQHQHKSGVFSVKCENILRFGICQQDISLDRLSVAALTGNTTEHV